MQRDWYKPRGAWSMLAGLTFVSRAPTGDKSVVLVPTCSYIWKWCVVGVWWGSRLSGWRTFQSWWTGHMVNVGHLRWQILTISTIPLHTSNQGCPSYIMQSVLHITFVGRPHEISNLTSHFLKQETVLRKWSLLLRTLFYEHLLNSFRYDKTAWCLQTDVASASQNRPTN